VIVCIGDVMVDVLTELNGPLAFGSDTPSRITLHGGGSAANTACWLAFAGASAAFIGRVGEDDLRRTALAQLARAGVQSHVITDPCRTTGTCVIMVSSDGERTMFPDTGANGVLDQSELPMDLITSAAWLHVSGYSLINPETRVAACAALMAATQSAVRISVDASSAQPLLQMGVTSFLDLLPQQTLLFANRDEARALAGTADLDRATAVLTARGLSVVIKSGPDGACWRAPGDANMISIDVDRVESVDSTGAGDAFAAGFIAAMSTGANPQSALTSGAGLAAIAVTSVGARP
jgi:sugar/nucleoside kinase (ribokinase family)